MTLGYFSPLPPARSGVADYAWALMEALRSHGSVTIGAGAPLNVYHVGNNPLHAGIYRRAIAEPGIVILHDAVLHHLLLGMLSEREYAEEFVHNYGEWSRTLAAELWRQRGVSGGDRRYFTYPMLRRLAERSRAIVVHNRAAERLVKQHAAAARVEVLPHLFADSASSGDATFALPAAATGPVAGVFGYLRESKRLESVLTAIRAIPRLHLLISGEFVSPHYERSIASFIDSRRVTRLGHATPSEFRARLAATDIVVNLKDPSAAETSGIAIQAMGMGKPVVVTEGEEWSGVPQAAVAPVEPGLRERPMLQAMLAWLTSSASARERMGELAREHIARHHAPAAVASQLWNIARSLAMLVLLLLPASGAVKREFRVAMRDGIRLHTIVLLPDQGDRFPAVLLRTPYNAALLPAQYSYLADAGFAVVMQDVRGRQSSDGVFDPLRQETNDTFDTLNWVAAQPWSTGNIGMTGGSYLGMVQWKAAALRHPALKAIFPIHAGSDEYYDRFYDRGGALRLGHRMLWLAENMGAGAPLAFPAFTLHLPLRTMDIAAAGRELAIWRQALDHPSRDGFWRDLSSREALGSVRIPAFSIAGWYDPNVASDLELFAQLRRTNPRAYLAVGAWPHSMTAAFAGVDYGPDHGYPVRAMQIAWFNRFLRDRQPSPEPAPLRIFVMGANRWRDESEWPLKRAVETKLYLGPNRSLVATPPNDGSETYVYNPRLPVMTHGGATCCNPRLFPWGPMDQRHTETRADVLTFRTEPLKDGMEVTGPVRVTLRVASSAPDTDFTAKLVDIFPNGEARNLTDGILRMRYRNGEDRPFPALSPDSIYQVTIQAGVTSNLFAAGHRLGIEISSSNFPKYDRNLNTGRANAVETELRPARQTIHFGRVHPSHAVLPVIRVQ